MPSVKVVCRPTVMAGACVDRQGEGLGGVRADAVAGRDGERVGAAGARGRRAGQGGGAVTVVDEGDAAGQRPRSPTSVGVGMPVAVTVKVPALPVVKVVLSAAGDGRGLR